MAEALAAAGADIVGTSLTIDSAGERGADARRRTRADVHGLPRRSRRSEDGAAQLAASVLGDGLEVDILVNNAGTIARAPALAHDDEQWRRVLQTNLTSQFVLARELGAPDGRARGRQDHLHRVDAELSGRGQRRSLHGVEIGCRRARSRARERVGAARRERERDRPGLLRNRQHTTAARRSGTVTRDPRADPRRPVGRPGRPGGGDRLPRVGALPTTCMGSCSPSTAAGSDGERRTGSRRGAACSPGRRRSRAGRPQGRWRRALAGAGASAVEITFRTRGRRGRDRSPCRRGLRRRRRNRPLGGAGGRRDRGRCVVRRFPRPRPRCPRTLRGGRRAGPAGNRDRDRS